MGVPKFIMGHQIRGSREGAGLQLAAWAEAENAKGHPCACGCGQAIKVLPRHRVRGIPKFVPGHNKRAVPGGLASAWAEVENAKGYQCACGCGGLIRVKERHRKRGIPRYIKGHNPLS